MSTEASSRCLRQFFDLTESAVIEWIAPGSMEASSSNPNEVTGDAFLAPAPPGARFLKMIQGMERKYATASSRPMPKRARRASAISKRKKAEGDDGTSVAASAVATLDGAIAAGTATTQAAGHDEEDKDAGADDDEGDEDEDAKSSNESWYDMDDDFIDDSEFLDKVYKGEEDEEDEDEEENGGRLASSSGGPAAAGSGGGEGAEGVRTAMAAGRLKASGFFISRGELRSESQLEAERARQSAREAELQRSSPRKRASAAHKAGESATSDGDAVPVPGSPNRIKAAATAAAAPPPPFTCGTCSALAGVGRQMGAAAGVPPPGPAGGTSGAGTSAGGGGGAASAAPVRTDCTVWHALCSFLRLLGEVAPTGSPPEPAEVRKLDEGLLEQRVKDAAGHRKPKVGIRDVKLAIERSLPGLQLAQADTWGRLARSLASKVTTSQAATLVAADLPCDAAPPPAAPPPATRPPVAPPPTVLPPAAPPPSARPPPKSTPVGMPGMTNLSSAMPGMTNLSSAMPSMTNLSSAMPGMTACSSSLVCEERLWRPPETTLQWRPPAPAPAAMHVPAPLTKPMAPLTKPMASSMAAAMIAANAAAEEAERRRGLSAAHAAGAGAASMCASGAPAAAMAGSAFDAAPTEASGAPKVRGAKTAFIFYQQTKRKEARDANTTLNTKEIDKVLQEWWKAETPEERQPFQAMAAEDRRRYEREIAAASALSGGSAPGPATNTDTAPFLD